MVGLEPTTPALRKPCSTIELHRHYLSIIYISRAFVKNRRQQIVFVLCFVFGCRYECCPVAVAQLVSVASNVNRPLIHNGPAHFFRCRRTMNETSSATDKTNHITFHLQKNPSKVKLSAATTIYKIINTIRKQGRCPSGQRGWAVNPLA